VKYWWEWR